MGFMQPFIYHGDVYLIDTTEGVTLVRVEDCGKVQHVDKLKDFLQGEPLDPDEVPEIQTLYYGRYSAPGYMDCTEWTWGETEEEVREELEEMYGDTV